ncbi:MAG: FdtA/QdtA family cupin domain-containing protein [Schumannella sp.]
MRRLPTFTDARGRLLVAEDTDIGFPVRRVFAVTGVPAGVVRGEHVVPCRQAMVLVAGGATVWSGPSSDRLTEVSLTHPGDTVDLPADSWVRYALASPDAVVLVFADAPFQPGGRA